MGRNMALVSTYTQPVPTETGILLLYTGSPETPEPAAVRRYLKRFLMDPHVLDMPAWARTLLVQGIIVPFRASRSALRYASIWMEEGSPLKVYTERFEVRLQEALPEYYVCSATAYGMPTIAGSVEKMMDAGVKKLVVFPLFPHHADATRGSLLAVLDRVLRQTDPSFESVVAVPPFYARREYLEAIACVARPLLDSMQPEYVIFSYHGLPLRQAHVRFPEEDPRNYEEQCLHTTALLTEVLALDPNCSLQAYQSRFGRRWLGPTLEHRLQQLGASGCKRVALLSPSFPADCLETLEELDLEGRNCFFAAGGLEYLRIPALNDQPVWVSAAAAMVRSCIEKENE
jgi:ferrochelatase